MHRENERARELFDRAVEIASAADRDTFVLRECGDDAPLRARMQGLLGAYEQAGSFLESPPVGVHEAATEDRTAVDRPGAVIGPYKLREKIGEGGMGVVYLAEQVRPVRRPVALKLIKAGMDTGQVVARFEAERQALALMDHPSIAKVFDAGSTEGGRPYFVMELVKGVPITEYCDAVHLSPGERLELFLPVCAAVQHAHQKGVIHRDLKPSNVLVAMQDGRAVPKVIDFGVAKATEQSLTERSLFTQHGAIVGTLEYMSPEQAEISAMGVDTRTDIYALGVLLYELLTGSTPLDRHRLRDSAYAEILRRIREEEPPKPSTRLSESGETLPSVAALRKTEPGRLARLVRGDLDWIVMKALEKDRTRRYETADGLARDIRRHLDGDPVEACPPSARYRLGKLARKHRAGLATAGAFSLLLVAATALSVGLALRADRERGRAVKAEAWAKEQQSRALDGERLAVAAVRRFGDVVRETPELRSNPSLAGLRAALLGEPQAFFRKLRDRLHAGRETAPDSLDRLAEASLQLGLLTYEIGDRGRALRDFEESLSIRERLASEYPTVAAYRSGLAGTYSNIGVVQTDTGRAEDALTSLEKSLVIRERLVREAPSVADFRRNLAESHFNIAGLKQRTGRRVEAMASFGKALAIRERLAREDPTVAAYRGDLAASLIAQGVLEHETGRLNEAVASYRQAREVLDQLVREEPTVPSIRASLARSNHNLGLLQHETGRQAEAMASLEQAGELLERLVGEDPTVLAYRSSLAANHYGLGIVLGAMGRAGDSLASFGKALAIRERLAGENPSVASYQSNLAGSQDAIGNHHNAAGQAGDALAWLEKALAIRERLARGNPSILAYQADLAVSYFNIGVVQVAAGRLGDAMESYQKALEIHETLAQTHPESPEHADGAGRSLNNMAGLELDQGRFAVALPRITRAMEWQRKVLAANPDYPESRRCMALLLTNLIRANEGLGRADEADEARRSLDALAANDPATRALDARLAAAIMGRAPEDNAGRLQLAGLAYEKALYATSARLLADALKDDPGLGDDRRAQNRYNAACAAVLAGSGRGRGEPASDEASRAKLRAQALEWLQAELSAWRRAPISTPPTGKGPAAEALAHWKADADLAAIRDEKELATLSDEERAAFRRLWADVDALLNTMVRRQ